MSFMYGSRDRDRFVAGQIKRSVRWLLRKPGFNRNEYLDLRQELHQRLLEQLPKYDPVRCSWFGFVKMVLRRSAAKIVRQRRQGKRYAEVLLSLSSLILHNGSTTELADCLTQSDHERRHGLRGRSPLETAQLKLDVAYALGLLPADKHAFADQLKVLSLAELARAYGVPYSTVQGWRRNLLSLLSTSELQEYL